MDSETVVISATVSEKNDIVSNDEIEMLAKMVYGEALVTNSDTEMSACAWVVLNRLDSGRFGGSVSDVITAPCQFFGYSADNPIDERVLALCEDVVERWIDEKFGVSCGRTLPADYLYFWGDGRHNHFTMGYGDGNEWDWSLESPYDN